MEFEQSSGGSMIYIYSKIPAMAYRNENRRKQLSLMWLGYWMEKKQSRLQKKIERSYGTGQNAQMVDSWTQYAIQQK